MSFASAARTLATYVVLLYVTRIQGRFRDDPLFCLNNDFIGRQLMLFGQYERDELEWIKQTIFRVGASKKLGVVLDVGANIGNHAVFFAKYADRVLAFEPNPATYLVLKANLLINRRTNVETYDCALGPEDGTAEFASNTTGNLGGSKIVTNVGVAEPTIPICVRRGDAIIDKDCAQAAVELVKVDVEGSELGALMGLAHMLSRDLPIVMFEANTGAARRPIVQFLRGLGYSNFGYLARRRRYSANRPIRWVQKLFDHEAVSLFELGDDSDAQYPVCLAFTRKHASRFGMRFAAQA